MAVCFSYSLCASLQSLIQSSAPIVLLCGISQFFTCWYIIVFISKADRKCLLPILNGCFLLIDRVRIKCGSRPKPYTQSVVHSIRSYLNKVCKKSFSHYDWSTFKLQTIPLANLGGKKLPTWFWPFNFELMSHGGSKARPLTRVVFNFDNNDLGLTREFGILS